MKIKRLTQHARIQIRERYSMEALPPGPRIFICSESNTRKLYRVGEVYFIWSKHTKRIVTFLTKEMADKTAKFYGRDQKFLRG